MEGTQSAVDTARILIDQNRCEGYGFCADAAPALLELDDDGILSVKREPADTDDMSRAEAAVRVCPVAALKLAK
jgi:ferredoxin